MKKHRYYPASFLLLLIPFCQSAMAVEKEYLRDYDYVATDYDSRFTSRINAIDGLKVSLLNEIGTYVTSVIEINKDSLGNAYMTQDTVQLTAGIISLNLLEEEWNRISYYVKGKMRADEDEVLQAVKALRKDTQLENALRGSLDELKSAREEISRLKQQMALLQSAASATKTDQAEATKGKLKQRELETQYVAAVQNIEVEQVFQQALRARIDGDFEKAVKLFGELAEKGYAKAQSRLGHMYEKGMGVAQDYPQALKWYQKAVAQGYAGSLAQIGFLYERGLGVSVDPVKAVSLFKEAIAGGSNFAKAHLGQLYVQGHMIEQDYEKALQLFKQSSAAGNGKGLSWMGFMYDRGYAVGKDQDKARTYYKKGIEKGNPWAMAQLGNMYMRGNGVAQDVEKAYPLILAGAERGNSFAIGKLGRFYENGWVVEQDKDKAFELYEESARLGSVFGQFSMGRAYHKAIGVLKDKDEAIEWYEKAAARGNKKAKKILNKLL